MTQPSLFPDGPSQALVPASQTGQMKQPYYIFNESSQTFIDRVNATSRQEAVAKALRCPGFDYRNEAPFQISERSPFLWRMNFTRPGEEPGTREQCCTDVFVFTKEEVKETWMAAGLRGYL